MHWGWYALGVAVVGGIAVAASSSSPTSGAGPSPDEPDPEPNTGSGGSVGTWKNYLYQGRTGDPQLEALLAELQAFLDNHGVDKSIVTAREVTRLPKATEVTNAIPPREYWPHAVRPLQLFGQVRARVGTPIEVRGYRPPWYNKAVGGARNSSHQEFSGFDFRASSQAEAKALDLATAQVWLEHPAEPLGFGAYGRPVAWGVHLDAPSEYWATVTGLKRRRTYEDGQFYVDKVLAQA